MNNALISTGLIKQQRKLAPLTTYKFGGPARFYAEVRTFEELSDVVVARGELPLLVLGRGSNLVISDDGFDGLVVRLSGSFLDVSVASDGVVVAGGAAPLPKLARTVAKLGRGGLEFFVGVPGSVGGAVRMNAGCHGSETSEWMIDAKVVSGATGQTSDRTPADLEFRYRHSNLTDDDIVASARFRTIDRTPSEAETIMREITQWRRVHQPGGTLNAGSVFKNPDTVAAGKLIDDLGLKGFAIGGASVSERHANFFVATAEATAQDVFDLVRAVRRRVGEETDIWLEPEVRFAGPFEVRDP